MYQNNFSSDNLPSDYRPVPNPFDKTKIYAYEVVDEAGIFVSSYSAHLSENTCGKLDGLTLAKDSLKCNRGYRIIEIYQNGYRKPMDL